MNSNTPIETFFYIGSSRLRFCIFENVDKKIFEKEIFIDDLEISKNLGQCLENFLEENIFTIEKKIGKFINEINLIIPDNNFLLIQASIKKNETGKKINKEDVNRLLFDLKQQIKENNLDKTITHMRINNFIIDKKKYLTLDDNFGCNELCLQVDFVCLLNKIKDIYSKKIRKYQININEIYSDGYLKKYNSSYSENECQVAANLKYENDENEVYLVEKISEKKGFFERFFKFFN